MCLDVVVSPAATVLVDEHGERLFSPGGVVPFRFFFQAEDGIRDDLVTGVQTCALPILGDAILTPLLDQIKTSHVIVIPHNTLNYIPFAALPMADGSLFGDKFTVSYLPSASKIGRASCRERE